MSKASEYFDRGLTYEQEENYQQAFINYSVAAELGHADAQNNLGLLYLNGRGTGEDVVQALEWFRKSAGQDNAYGWWNVGRCYANGWGVEIDQAEAFRAYLHAAELGHSGAQNQVGHMLQRHRHGPGRRAGLFLVPEGGGPGPCDRPGQPGLLL